MPPSPANQVNILCLGAVGLSSIVLTIAHDEGMFERRGVAARLVRVPGTDIPKPNRENPIGYIGAPAALMRASSGADIKILACFHTGRLSGCLVVNADIAAPEQLRGRRLDARVEAAALWIHTVLALEFLGLKLDSDDISIDEIGDPSDILRALEAGEIAGAVLPRALCEPLISRGYALLLDLLACNLYGAPDALVATTSFLRDHPSVVESIVAALIEAAAFVLSSHAVPTVLDATREELAVAESGAALAELSTTLARKPYPSVERLSSMQRVMARRRPDVLRTSVAGLIDDTIVQKLDRSGFIKATYAAYGMP